MTREQETICVSCHNYRKHIGQVVTVTITKTETPWDDYADNGGCEGIPRQRIFSFRMLLSAVTEVAKRDCYLEGELTEDSKHGRKGDKKRIYTHQVRTSLLYADIERRVTISV